ncbi:MAG TPA: DUF1476 domain-containing protein [Rhizobiaceae bacterium]|nr:DUF1476 domain-containing protein [Rhizobiaceae bacterium]
MAEMDDRERGFERKFAFDEELRFKATARRNKLFGLWAANQIGKSGSDADAYAREVVIADLSEAGDQDVIRKVLGDFKAAGVASDEGQLKLRLIDLMAQAIKQVEQG